MALLTETYESPTDVTIVFRRLYLPYYMCVLAMALIVAPYLSDRLAYQELQILAWVLVSMGLLGIFYGWRLLSSLQRQGFSRVGGYMLSVSNPLTIRAQKIRPDGFEDVELEPPAPDTPTDDDLQ